MAEEAAGTVVVAAAVGAREPATSATRPVTGRGTAPTLAEEAAEEVGTVAVGTVAVAAAADGMMVVVAAADGTDDCSRGVENDETPPSAARERTREYGRSKQGEPTLDIHAIVYDSQLRNSTGRVRNVGKSSVFIHTLR